MLAKYLVDEGSVAWLRRGEGMVGICGRFAEVEVAGPAEADDWWSRFIAGVEHSSEVTGVAGSGPVAFARSPSIRDTPPASRGWWFPGDRRTPGRSCLADCGQQAPSVELVGALVELVETPSPRPPKDVRILADVADEERWQRRVAEADPGSRATAWRRWCWLMR